MDLGVSLAIHGAIPKRRFAYPMPHDREVFPSSRGNTEIRRQSSPATQNLQFRNMVMDMSRSSLDAALERTRSLINAACENIYLARDLREACRELRYANSDFREFLREQLLRAQSTAQRRHECSGRGARSRKRDSISERPA
jgi:hypothetical protein